MPKTLLIHNARLVDGGTIIEDGWIVIEHDRITHRGSGEPWVRADETRDVGGDYLAPGFVDIHSHGGGGHSSEGDLDSIRDMAAFHRSQGTTSMVISLSTAPFDLLLRRLTYIRAAAAEDDRILGAHLEGPFLDPVHRGAHDEALLLTPTLALADELLGAAGGCLRQITLAPERAPAGVIDRFLEAGVRVAVGHTSATATQARRAFDQGATLLTHAFNGMPGIHHRDPGPVVAALERPVTLEIIADGVHVDPSVIALLFALAPGRVALITDAMAAAGADDGVYQLTNRTVVVRDGIARLGADGPLAGSTLTLARAIHVAAAAGIPVPDVIRAATTTPARAIGVSDPVGTLAVGAFADLVLLDRCLNVETVWSRGVEIPRTAHGSTTP